MYKPYEPHQIEWRGVPIEVRYCSSWSKSHEEIYGERVARLPRGKRLGDCFWKSAEQSHD